jgi:hypothetical protein
MHFKHARSAVVYFTLLVSSTGVGSLAADPGDKCGLSAVGYYMAATARVQDDDLIYVFGASNLPPGSILTIHIYDFIGEGSHILNEDATATVGSDGVFRVGVKAAKQAKFKINQVCDVVFSSNYPKQLASVIKIVGKAGENLGNTGTNPQVQDNGTVRLLDTAVAVVG